ncbi:GNAT family N-acetyltransferase [Streptomyces sp. Ru71]|uniref:GNAT family N-acetyltransferase n=1 Tax=Streptomyces sp. Ru71 TaxID=2080746 RepID=UPI000CDDCECC|nr:GNAT family N-acetyltransferase [Streptomyces sp. Ru71]POX56516.1 GNAT family N-acetyltransferase [Streptomyces sp. Ru71]
MGDEAHVVWAVQARPDGRPGPGVRVYRAGAAVAVASPALSGRDRIAVAGPADDALPLVRQALREAGPAYRPFGDAALIAALARAIPGLEAGPPFCWMETSRVPDRPTQAVRWLDSAGQREACALFDRHFPGSYAQPGRPGVHRWAGAHDEAGRLLAVAADAWSAPGCGFLAGVVTDPRARGRGLASAVSRFVTAALVRHRGRAALMVDEDNAPAIAVYERTGMTRRRFAAAGLTRRASPPG